MLSQSVLLLNQNYEPLKICDVKKAIILIYLGKAEAIENDSGWIRSLHFRMPMPLVVRLIRYARAPKRRILLNRKNLLIRDKHTCQYCGRKTPPLTVDHVIPRQFGGKDTWENLVIACLTCNNKKANRTPEQADMQLLEYKRFKEASGEFYDIETERRKYFSRKVPKKQKKKVVIEEEFEIEATLFDLLTAFKRALDNMPKITVHQVRQIKISIEDQVRVIVADMGWNDA